MKKAVLGILATSVILVVLLIWPNFYNHYLFSLAQLKNSISVGDSYGLVVGKFQEYQIAHASDSELQVLIIPDKLFIYHVNVFDDCQLTVIFGEGKKVKEIEYIAD